MADYDDSASDEFVCPEIDRRRVWAIVRIQSNLRHITVARFRDRAAAEEYRNFLSPVIPNAQFEVVFEPH